jgi:chemotaxis response regulator CheB
MMHSAGSCDDLVSGHAVVASASSGGDVTARCVLGGLEANVPVLVTAQTDPRLNATSAKWVRHRTSRRVKPVDHREHVGGP